MDAARFDTLTRSLGSRTSRRVAVGLAVSGLLGVAVPDAEAARCSRNRPCPQCKRCKQHRCRKDATQDGQDCTGGACQNGVCTAECSSPQNCPGTDTDCQTRTCTGGTCGMSFANAGTAVTVQTAGDCKKTVCDGNGGTTNEVDNTDLPADDGDDCTQVACISGTPQFANQPSGSPCIEGGQPGTCNGSGACIT
jgi:hypothetical protein